MNGFTLIELLVVLLFAGAAIALAAPQLMPARHALMAKSCARELASALRAARSEAIARQREVAFVPGPALQRRLLEARVAVSGMDPAIRFFADGTSSGASVVLAASGRRHVVDVDRVTGRVAVRE